MDCRRNARAIGHDGHQVAGGGRQKCCEPGLTLTLHGVVLRIFVQALPRTAVPKIFGPIPI
jgi:hypothetical protein